MARARKRFQDAAVNISEENAAFMREVDEFFGREVIRSKKADEPLKRDDFGGS